MARMEIRTSHLCSIS